MSMSTTGHRIMHHQKSVCWKNAASCHLIIATLLSQHVARHLRAAPAPTQFQLSSAVRLPTPCPFVIMKTFFVALLLLAAVVGSQAAYANTTLATGWKNCGDSSYTAQNLQVTISPANPQPGDSYTYTSSYDLTKPVETGSTETIKLTLRGIPVENKTTDLCTALAKTDTPCPIAAGHVTSVTKGTIPTDAPSGTLIATASWKDQAGNNVLCIQLEFDLQ